MDVANVHLKVNVREEFALDSLDQAAWKEGFNGRGMGEDGDVLVIGR